MLGIDLMMKDASANTVTSKLDQNQSFQIMLVEDEIIVAMDLEQRLEMLGYKVVAHASSGKEALKYASSIHIDLILMDVKLRTEMDGIDTAANIRKTLDIPIIYLTAFADELTLRRARKTDAHGYLVKPFEDRELRSTIEIALYKYKTEKKLRESEERYSLVVRAANDGIWDWNLLEDKIYFSPRWANMLGFDPKLLSNLPGEWLDRIHPDDQRQVMQALSAHLTGRKPTFESEYRIRHQDGAYRFMICRGLALYDNQSIPYRMAGSQSDITERKRFEHELIHKALYDDLTGLPNRILFVDRLSTSLDQYQRMTEKESVVLFLDIDKFKLVNDSFGHGWGDRLLIQIAKRLEKCLRPGDTVSRFGGDEFAILLDRVDELRTADQIAKRVQDDLAEPFNIDDRDIFITASIGIIHFNTADLTTDEILRDVDIAMYSAKNKGGARHETFDKKMRENTMHRMGREIELHRALKDDEFILHYQPVFTAIDQELVGFEALIRWQHPTRNLLYPGEFINIAEETKLIIPIGNWVLKNACAQARAWNANSIKPYKISVNISRIQLLDENFIHQVKAALSENNLAPDLLELEITESTAMEDVDLTFDRLEQLRQIGVSVAIDDFGTGYSSMEHLKHFKASILKIDRSFINEMKEEDLAIITAVITLAHKLQLKTVAEGVETEKQLTILSNMKCDEVQGFYLGKGIPANETWNLITSNMQP